MAFGIIGILALIWVTVDALLGRAWRAHERRELQASAEYNQWRQTLDKMAE